MEITEAVGVLYLRDGDEIHVVPVEAIASWGELLGLPDEEALAAIIAQHKPPVLTDHPEDQGWLAPYLALADAVRTGAEVARALAARVDTTGAQLDARVLSAMGAFGADVVIAHAEAIREGVQRTVRPTATHLLPAAARERVRARALEIAKCRAEFCRAAAGLPAADTFQEA